MNFKVLIAMGIVIAGVVILAGFFNNEFSLKPSAFTPSAIANAPVATAVIAANDPRRFTSPSNSPGFVSMVQSPGAASTSPGLINVAQPFVEQEKTNTPANFIPANIELSEAHWQGMDVTKLTAELRQKLRYPRGLLGIMIDEVTLNAAGSGFLAGDIITHIEKIPVTTLEQYQQASRSVRSQRKATLTVLRKAESDGGRYSMRRVSLALPGDPDLGFAQVEAAPMIVPGDGRPHPYRGACTRCHTIGTGFELTPDPDLITLQPPTLSHATVVKGINPHRDRGQCEACHLIIR
jgi:hypothetical protein